MSTENIPDFPLGQATVCVLGGALTVVAAMFGLLHPAIRRLD